MALRFPARTKGSTTQTGTLTTFTIDEVYDAANPVNGWRSFTKAVTQGDLANGDTIPIAIVDTTVAYDGSNMIQVCTATWNNTTKQFTVVQNYQPAVPPNWGGGRRDVLAMDEPALFLLLAGGTLTGLLKILISGAIITPAASTSLIVQRSATSGTDVGVSVIGGATGRALLNLGNDADEDEGGVYYNSNTNELVFRTSGADGSKVNSSGNLVTAVGTPYDSFTGGGATVLPFYQAAAPTGWTKSTANNDKALRVVSGTGGGSGGSRALSATTTGDHTLTIPEIPPHTHTFTDNELNTISAPATGSFNVNVVGTTETSSTGGGDPHNHPLALAYIDVIICSKN